MTSEMIKAIAVLVLCAGVFAVLTAIGLLISVYAMKVDTLPKRKENGEARPEDPSRKSPHGGEQKEDRRADRSDQRGEVSR